MRSFLAKVAELVSSVTTLVSFIDGSIVILRPTLEFGSIRLALTFTFFHYPIAKVNYSTSTPAQLILSNIILNSSRVKIHLKYKKVHFLMSFVWIPNKLIFLTNFAK